MNIYTRKQRWKMALLLVAVSIGVASMWYTNDLVKQLSEQEKKNVELWASAVRQAVQNPNDHGDVTFVLDVLTSNKTIPRILTNERDEILSSENVDTAKLNNDPTWRDLQLKQMKSEKEPIIIPLGDNGERISYTTRIP